MKTENRKRKPGGGRKPVVPGGLRSITVTLSASDIEYLRSIDGNISAAVRKLIQTAASS